MSSFSFRKPEFRLHLGYPDIHLTSGKRTLGRIPAQSPDLRAALLDLTEPVRRARGRLVAVLPEAEVWRGRLELPARNRLQQRSLARAAVAARLGVAPGEVALAMGPARAPLLAVAGARRSTLTETRALLAAVGLRPAAIVGAGLFPGFAATPRLGGWSLPFPLPTVAPERRGLAAALGAGAVATLAILALGLPGEDAAPVAERAALGVPQSLPLIAEASFLPTAAVETAAAAPVVVETPLALAAAMRPKPRPAAPLGLPLVTVAARNMPPDLPAEMLAPKPAPTRLPDLAAAPARALERVAAPLRRPAASPDVPAAKAEVKQVARTAQPVLPAPATASSLRPMPRPEAPAKAASAKAAKPTAAAGLAPEPRPRGSAQPAMLVASLEPAPLMQESIAAASAATVAAALAAPPPPRPASLEAKPKVAAKPVPKPAPAVAKAAPVVVRPAPAPALQMQPLVQKAAVAPAVVAAPKPVPVPVKPVPVKPVVKSVAVRPAPVPVPVPVKTVPLAAPSLVAVATPQLMATRPAPVVRQKVVAVPAKPKPVAKTVPVRTAAQQVKPWAPEPMEAVKPRQSKPTAQRVGLSRGNISLVGVFAGADGRRALVRLPSGAIERVKVGDSVQGVQIAAINDESVQVSGRGRDTLLKLPD